MLIPDDERDAVGNDARAVMVAAQAAGVYVSGGGIDETTPPVRVAADGSVAAGGYPWAPPLNGGFTMLELPTREDAVRGRRALQARAAAIRNCASFTDACL